MFLEYGDTIANIVIIDNVALCFCAISVSYILILKRLYAKNVEISSRNSKLKADRQNGVPKTSQAIHIKTMNMFGSITLIFVAMLIIMAGIYAQSIHDFHINVYDLYKSQHKLFHIYIYFNGDFRKDVLVFFKRL